MKDFIATAVIIFISGLLQAPVRDYLNGFMHELGGNLTGDDAFVSALLAFIIVTRKWLRFEQRRKYDGYNG